MVVRKNNYWSSSFFCTIYLKSRIKFHWNLSSFSSSFRLDNPIFSRTHPISESHRKLLGKFYNIFQLLRVGNTLHSKLGRVYIWLRVSLSLALFFVYDLIKWTMVINKHCNELVVTWQGRKLGLDSRCYSIARYTKYIVTRMYLHCLEFNLRCVKLKFQHKNWLFLAVWLSIKVTAKIYISRFVMDKTLAKGWLIIGFLITTISIEHLNFARCELN